MQVGRQVYAAAEAAPTFGPFPHALAQKMRCLTTCWQQEGRQSLATCCQALILTQADSPPAS